MASKKTTKSKLNPNQIKFCEYYVTEEFFCNGVKSYMKAYPNAEYNTAKTEAGQYLTKPHILEYIDKLLDLSGFNDQRVDKELSKLVIQDEDRGNKLGAIKEYNKLKQRITDNLKVTGSISLLELHKNSEK